MAHDIQKVSIRKQLKPRREPYWLHLERGRSVGFRKLDERRETWLARRKREESAGHTGSAAYETKPLGEFPGLADALKYGAALKAATEWFGSRAEGISDEPPTVEAVCKEYVEDRRTEKGEKTAYDAKIRFKRNVYDKPLGQTRLIVGKLTTKKLKDWRSALPGTKSAQDREFRTLKAALNLAVRNRRCSPGLTIEWKAVPPNKKADRRRELFLDLAQRRALIEAAEGGTRDLIEAAALTGARPGELVSLRVKDFDQRTNTIAFQGKTDARRVPLSPTATAFFTKLAKSKLPTAFMLTMDDGEPWKHPTWWAEAVREAAARAELPSGVVLYTLRHSWITEALRGGLSTLDVARMSGTSLQMIQSHYGHLVLDSARERLKDVVML